MHSRRLATGLSALALAAAALSAQCEKSQGNAHLGLSGLHFLGCDITLAMEGRPKSRFALAMDLPTNNPMRLPWGTICLSPNYHVLMAGLVLDQAGVSTMKATIPNLPVFEGLSVCFQGAVDDPAAPNKFLALSNKVAMTVRGVSPVKTIFFEDFEVDRGRWFASNGLWDTGTPSKVGPTTTYSGSRCAGTGLSAKYPSAGSDTRLEGPRITLPSLAAGEQIRVNYRMWYSTEDAYDYAILMVSEDLKTWRNVPRSPAVSGWNPLWTQFSADLSAYAGKNIYLGFRFVSRHRCTYSSSCYANGDGVYVDDVHVFKGKPATVTTETFEEGIGFWWHSDNGVWQVGTPTVGPKTPASTGSKKCVGTVLHGNYPSAGTNTRLISAPITLPPASSAVRNLVFKEWTHTELNYDRGVVQVSTDNGATWMTMPAPASTGSNTAWTSKRIPLVDDAGKKIAIQGKTILIGFYFESTHRCTYSSSCYASGYGWYLDDIQIR